MLLSEQEKFFTMMVDAYALYGKDLTRGVLDLMFEALQEHPLEAISQALGTHVKCPNRGRFPPLIADIVAKIEALKPARLKFPSADEAWAIALRTRDEHDSIVVFDELMAAFGAAGEILDTGDEVGARMAFRDVYEQEVMRSRMDSRSPRWWLTPGWDRSLRELRIREGVERGLLPVALLEQITPPIADNRRRVASNGLRLLRDIGKKLDDGTE